jgi:N-carbamoylputrescine amidase
MPFVDWKIFTNRTVERRAWQRVLAEHDAMVPRLAELGAELVLASRPVEHAGRRLNQGFAWTRDGGCRAGRAKFYLPDEPDGWEASWFDRGELDPSPLTVRDIRVGFQFCTEMLFTNLSWEIGRAGAQLIAAPRATGSHRRWITAASLMAVVSGCFVASANRRSYEHHGFAGQSWVVSPEGELLASTTAESPFATVEVDLRHADAAKRTYPRNLGSGRISG